MYKINTNNNHTNNNQYDTNNNNINNLDTSSKILNEDINNMHLQPPECTSQNISYKDFYNDESKLKPVAPYRLGIVKHPKNGVKQVIQYRNFYRDSSPNARKYNAPEQKDIEDKILHDSSRLPMFYDSKLKLYEETRRKNDFAKPIAGNGSNKLSVMYNDCLNKTTFEYTRFGNRGTDNKYWVDNPIYSHDISQETNMLNNNYMKSIKISTENLYASVFEDMYFLTTNANAQNNNNNKDGEINTYISSRTTQNLQKS